MRKFILAAATFFWTISLLPTAQSQVNTAPQPDDRFKVDILVIVAHPEDETEVTGYLARAIFDQQKRVAIIIWDARQFRRQRCRRGTGWGIGSRTRD